MCGFACVGLCMCAYFSLQEAAKGGKGKPVEKPKFWSCSACTFDNEFDEPICIMCDARKPELATLIKVRPAHLIIVLFTLVPFRLLSTMARF